MRRLPSSVLVVVAICLVAAACSGPRYRYVRDTHTRTAFRVPTNWTIFDKATMLGLPPGPQPNVPDPLQWLVGIDGSPQASVSHILNVADLTTDQPQGIGLVQTLSFTERDSASISYLRNFLFPVDQLIQNGSDGALVSYDDKLVENGLHGVHLVLQFRASKLASAVAASQSAAGSSSDASSNLQRALLGGAGADVLSPKFVEVDQKALIDDAANRVYYVAILCSATCYQQNRGAIESAVDSWTVIS
ncbi:MAG TPA: hypothetical protein VK646_03680 [Actinomycetota bacterium]|nr:hypothetical protein [Actinomycetota bacterium]